MQCYYSHSEFFLACGLFWWCWPTLDCTALNLLILNKLPYECRNASKPFAVFLEISACAASIALVGALGLPFDFNVFASWMTCAFLPTCSYSAAFPYVPQMTVLIGVDGLFGMPKEYCIPSVYSIGIWAEDLRSCNDFPAFYGIVTMLLAPYLN